MEPEEAPQSPNASLANFSAIPGTDGHSKALLKKFHWAIKQVATEHNHTSDETALTEEELIELVRTWEPQRDIICLYVRWSRQLRRNFNLDSIATLLCLSRQCGYTPLDFLRKVKTVSILKNQKAAYGFTFNFDVPLRQQSTQDKLNKEFIGLSVTLALLQEQVTESPSILGRTKMRQHGPRHTQPIGVHIEGKDNQPVSITTHPNTEFHTQSSLLNRIWLSIKHRWISLFLTEHLFREAHQPSWSFQEGLIYSFQMMAPCGPGRFEFLSPLVGYCLRFPTQASIDSKRSRLRDIWNDPTAFLPYGNTCLTQCRSDALRRIITACFQELHEDFPPTAKQISYNRDSTISRRWCILRAYVFHFWLESTPNEDLKDIISKGLTNVTTARKKRKADAINIAQIGNHDNTSTNSTQEQEARVHQSTTTQRNKNGLQSIISTRRSPNLSNGTTCHQPPVVINTIVPVGKELGVTETDWRTLRLVTSDELQRMVQSYLLIHRADGVDLLCELAPLEVYSADNLHDLSHCRLSGITPFFPSKNTGPVVLHVRPEADEFIDVHAKSLHVARERSEHFVEHSHHLPTMNELQDLCRAISRHGKVDAKRAIGQYRLNIGNGGQNWINGAPCQLHGLQFEKELQHDCDFDSTKIIQSIGQVVEFTWKVMCSLQEDSQDQPIAPDPIRKQLYAQSLNKYLNMDSEIGFEDVTLVVSSLHPVAQDVTEHKDTMNDILAGYTRTAAFNMVLIGNNDDLPSLIHFQIICNFRKVIGHYVVPFHSYVSNVAKHGRLYLQKWERSMQALYGGKTDKVPRAHDRSSFFLDDCLQYTTVAISEKGKHKQSLSGEYILTDINISRTLSMSMFIDPIVKLQSFLSFDQTIELAFACSFLSNPFWFDWTMSGLIEDLDDPDGTFLFQAHPFYDWAHCTINIFGAWQGGPYNRWSPCGGNKESVLETFGAHPTAPKDVKERGKEKLEKVVSVLNDHIEWINSMAACNHIPLSTMKERCNQTIEAIAKVASCQFSHFRLGILTTILSGCGLLKPGKHLRDCMYPVKGAASYKHLCNPTADYMSREKASALGNNENNESISNDGEGCVKEEHHDLFMRYLSAELGFKEYIRDEIECILCESHPMRSLNCRDWFRKGMSLYDCNENGEYFSRAYGKNTKWVKLSPPDEYEYSYLGTTSILYIPVDGRLSYYSLNFGEDLRSTTGRTTVKFKGRNTRTSSHQRSFTNTYQSNETFCHPSMQMADFYMGSHVKMNPVLQSMFVLGDTEHAVKIKDCNDLGKYPSGKDLHAYLQSLLSNDDEALAVMAAGCYHMDSELSNNETTFFPGHLDKPFVHTVWFVPLGSTAFFTVLAVEARSTIIQDEDSLSSFNEWLEKLNASERQKVDDFLGEFDSQAKKYMRQDSVNRLIYLNKLGSVLSFPANRCYHATITPKKPPGYPRDLFIFHPLDGISCAE